MPALHAGWEHQAFACRVQTCTLHWIQVTSPWQSSAVSALCTPALTACMVTRAFSAAQRSLRPAQASAERFKGGFTLALARLVCK